MSINWHHLAIAVACGLEQERLSERGAFIDEAALVRASAAFIQATTQLLLEPELPHPDLIGAQRLDLSGRAAPAGNLSFVAEAKWLRSGGGVRNWPAEVAKDILRLERLANDTTGSTDRAIIVGGIRRSIKANLLEVQINADGGRVEIAPHLLQVRDPAIREYPYNQVRIDIRSCDVRVEDFWLKRAQAFSDDLPVSYQCALAGHHKAGPTQEAVEVHVWLIRRSRNRSDFSAEATFGDA